MATLDPTRAAEIQALAASGDVHALVAALMEPSWVVRREVVATLARVGDGAIPALIEVLRSVRDDERRLAAAVDALVACEGRVEAAISALAADPNPAIAADAAQVLGRRARPDAVPTLLDLAEHADDNVAVTAIEALGRVGGRAAVECLVGAVHSGNFFRTYPAIDVLGRTGDPRAVAPLVELLGDSRYRLEAARALGRTGDRSAVAALGALLLDGADATVRIAALALAELRDRHRQRYGIVEPIDAALRELNLPENAVRRLEHSLGDADALEKAAVCAVLGALGSAAAAPTLTLLLGQSGPVATAAADALLRLADRTDVRILDALRQADSAQRAVLLPMVRAWPGAVEAVVACLADPDPTVRAVACDAAGRLRASGALPTLFERLADENPRVVHAAVGAIQAIGGGETQQRALEAARSTNPRVRRAALRIIAHFGYGTALDVLLEAIESPEDAVRDSAIFGLPFIDDPRATEALLAAGRHPEARARASAARAMGQCPADLRVVGFLVKGLTDPDPWVRYYACQSLGRLGWDPAARAIAAHLHDEAGQVRVAAVEALSHLSGDTAHEALAEAAGADDPDVRRSALVGLGIARRPESLPVLLAAARCQDSATRLVALSAVTAYEEPAATAVLHEAARDPDSSVRGAAIGFLAGRTGSDAAVALIDLLRAGDEVERVLAALSVPSLSRVACLTAALESADDELAPLLTSALARMRRPESTAALLGALEIANVPARKAAAGTLAGLRTVEARGALLRAASRDPDPEVRTICAIAIGQ